MLLLQNNMNIKVNFEWFIVGYGYLCVVMVELVEVIDYYGWKWWKV